MGVPRVRSSSTSYSGADIPKITPTAEVIRCNRRIWPNAAGHRLGGRPFDLRERWIAAPSGSGQTAVGGERIQVSRGPISYARSGDVSIAYQVVGDVPRDIVM